MDGTKKEENKCYCLEAFREKYGPHVQGECMKLSCANYRKHKGIDKKGPN
ncbi:hypothetical protein J7J00_05245 [Bacillus sp. ISL-4]|nr:hypothetical protein [Bacillus sp. ISL-4]MBT2664892.1 hypothetical protein [Bacillus sp. ISL-4]MBT2672187.1 hypothetical protein [Streptomyces sp. ISL-14]